MLTDDEIENSCDNGDSYHGLLRVARIVDRARRRATPKPKIVILPTIDDARNYAAERINPGRGDGETETVFMTGSFPPCEPVARRTTPEAEPRHRELLMQVKTALGEERAVSPVADGRVFQRVIALALALAGIAAGAVASFFSVDPILLDYCHKSRSVGDVERSQVTNTKSASNPGAGAGG